jgi:hypothetical protein
MVRGIDVFREHFQQFTDQFILIGGAACDLLFEEAGLQFRATKDLDIVLCRECLDDKFISAFWEFIQSGGYEIHQSSSGRPQFYRFGAPQRSGYPYMLELFSRGQEDMPLPQGKRYTRISSGEESSSLSAILLDEEYYQFLKGGVRSVSGIPLLGPEHLIPLKVRAFLDLRKRKAAGESIDSKHITKHKNDIFRLLRIADPESRIGMPASIRSDVEEFIPVMQTEIVDLPALGFDSMTKDAALAELRRMYCP